MSDMTAKNRKAPGWLAAPLAVVLALVLAGCGPSDASAPGLPTTPSLAQVGPATVTLDTNAIEEITPAPAPVLPVTVTSFDGEQVTVTDASRILAVDLYGTFSEIVFSLGLGDNVIGRDTATGFSQAAHLPLVSGSGHDLNVETILALNPTVILTDTSIGPPEVLAQLRSAGIPVVFLDPARTLPGIAEHITAVAAALGVPETGVELNARVSTQIAAARALMPESATPARIAFVYVRGTAGVYLMGGPGSGADSLIDALGAQDAGTAIGLTQSFTPITSEGMINAAPDVLLVMSAGLKSVGGVDALLALPGLGQTPAGENRRVIDVSDTQLLSFAPSTARTLTALAGALYN